MTNPYIIYFHHCGRIIFGLNCPNKCPLCLLNLESEEFISLPYPFNKAEHFPGAVLMKPTEGDFLNTYLENADLHIAVTTSKGDIVEYDSLGLRIASSNTWAQCLMLYQVEEIWHDHWDSQLAECFSKTDCWSAEKYNELSFNCYTFVLSFLRLLGLPDLTTLLQNKNIFCDKLILPKTKSALKYISVYRRLQVQPFAF